MTFCIFYGFQDIHGSQVLNSSDVCVKPIFFIRSKLRRFFSYIHIHMFWHYLVVIITPAAKFKCSLGYYELPTFIEEVCQGIELYLYFGLFIIVTAQELYVLCLKVNI